MYWINFFFLSLSTCHNLNKWLWLLWLHLYYDQSETLCNNSSKIILINDTLIIFLFYFLFEFIDWFSLNVQTCTIFLYYYYFFFSLNSKSHSNDNMNARVSPTLFCLRNTNLFLKYLSFFSSSYFFFEISNFFKFVENLYLKKKIFVFLGKMIILF